MEQKNKELTQVLNSLIEINNDRVAGYENALENWKEVRSDLKVHFENMADESRSNLEILQKKVAELGDEAADDSTLSGKIFRVWMDIKSTFTATDEDSVLTSCLFGEEAASKAYKQALAEDAQMGAATRQMIIGQKEAIETSIDKIKIMKTAGVALA